MTPEEAYKKLSGKDIPMKVIDCLDFGNFYAFSLAPLNVETDEKYCVGTVFDAVDKKTGKTFLYDITDDVNAFYKAKRLSVNTFFNIPINVLKQSK